MKRRHIQIYGDYFTDFFEKQNEQVRLKILKVLEIIETIDRIPETYLKHLRDGLFEIRIQLEAAFSGSFASSTMADSSSSWVGSKRKRKRHPQKSWSAHYDS